MGQVPGGSKELTKLLCTALLFTLGTLAAAAEPVAVAISGAWVRALPPGQPNTAAYLTVTNAGAAAVSIVGARAPIAERAEIHTTREVDGLQRMVQLEQLPLAPGESLTFVPGGTHLMLLGLKQMPAPGDEVDLCLLLAEGAEVCTVATVRRSAGGEQTHDHHQH
jgi:copper(I)-binding protein